MSLGVAAPSVFAQRAFGIARNFDNIVGIPIVLGGNLLTYVENVQLPNNSIIFNLEQVEQGSSWFTPQYIDLLKSYQVWDYSDRNIDNLKRFFGISGVKKCSIGYVPQMTRLSLADEPDIDVLFYGSINERRQSILEGLKEKGLNVKILSGVYGQMRDDWIARSKLVINIHYYSAQVLELVRLSYLLANKVCIVSETGLDKSLEIAFQEGIAFADYDNLVETCVNLIKGDRSNREAIAQKGYNIFSSLNQSIELRELLNNL
ncbi:hypothetical protein [Geminocystis sp. NIES-3709]|uniref:hypothetical protein n=1 Tax=Geminocystis sp. NIES-3709 TaxID=1617448 RepID=UPI00118764A6|nr:hypothetical protein [Geminocystis sp. NIES-3709]